MFRTIAKREFLDYLKSLRFLVGLLVTVALAAISTAINVSDYRQRHEDYSAARVETKGDPFNVKVFRAPEPLSTLVQGKDRSLGNLAELTPMDIPVKLSGYMGEYISQQHRFVSGFAAIDFAFIVRVVLSLLVIFLAYTAIAGEKASGTLRLALANPVARHAILLGKLAGGLGAILLSLVAATITALLILTLNPGLSLSTEEWLRTAGIAGVSVIYLMLFFALGLFISAAVNRPSTALAILLQIWIVLVLILPNVSVVLAENISPLPSEQEIFARKAEVYSAGQPKIHALSEEMNRAYRSGKGFPEDLMVQQTELFAEIGKTRHKIDLEFSDAQKRQERLTALFSIFSPAFLYDRTATSLARTGLGESDRFSAALERYWYSYIDATLARWRAYSTRASVKFPEFSFSPEPADASLSSCLADVLVLALLSLIFFALSYTTFLRKDVR